MNCESDLCPSPAGPPPGRSVARGALGCCALAILGIAVTGCSATKVDRDAGLLDSGVETSVDRGLDLPHTEVSAAHPEVSVSAPCTEVSISAAGAGGQLYIDDVFTGKTTPALIPAPEQVVRIGVATDDGRYLEKEWQPSLHDCTIGLDEVDAVVPVEWKVLYLDLRSVEAGGCELSFTSTERDAIFAFFQESVSEHIEPFTMGIHAWKITRVKVETTVPLSSPNGYFSIEPDDIPFVATVTPGSYDNIFTVWRGLDDNCEIPAPYFGASFGPEPKTRQAGWITVRMPEADIFDLLSYLRAFDPGVFVHEWMHTSVENHYGKYGAPLPPVTSSDGSLLHSGEDYGYHHPWMDWYRDLVSGRVDVAGQFTGVPPDFLRSCTIRQMVQGCVF